MESEIPVSLGVEDDPSEHLLRVLLAKSVRNYVVMYVYKGNGFGLLKRQVHAFNNAAKGSTQFMLTDLDTRKCVTELLEDWFGCKISEYRNRRHRNFIFCVAIREVEAWIMADRERFAQFVGLPAKLIPKQADDIPDPKALLLALVAKSRKRDLRDDMLPRPGDSRKIGPDYNGRLGDFLRNKWRPEVAQRNSSSLARIWNQLNSFQPVLKTPNISI